MQGFNKEGKHHAMENHVMENHVRRGIAVLSLHKNFKKFIRVR